MDVRACGQLVCIVCLRSLLKPSLEREAHCHLQDCSIMSLENESEGFDGSDSLAEILQLPEAEFTSESIFLTRETFRSDVLSNHEDQHSSSKSNDFNDEENGEKGNNSDKADGNDDNDGNCRNASFYTRSPQEDSTSEGESRAQKDFELTDARASGAQMANSVKKTKAELAASSMLNGVWGGDAQDQDEREERGETGSNRGNTASTLKRSAHEASLRQRNEELELSRELYLRRIAELQLEVNALRSQGMVDLRKENKLLRIEIFKHKTFLSRMLELSQNMPYPQHGDNILHLQEIVDSAISQISSLAHLSTKWSKLHTVQGGDDLALDMQVYVDSYPKNVEIGSIRRINLRNEIIGVPLTAENLHKCMATFWTNEEKLRQVHATAVSDGQVTYHKLHLDIPGLSEAMESLQSSKIKVASFEEQERGEINLKFTTTACETKREFAPRILLGHCSGEVSNEIRALDGNLLQSCYVFASTTCDQEFSEVGLQTSHTLKSKFLSGHIIFPSTNDPQSSHMLMFFSVPIGGFSFLSSPHDCFEKDGSFTPLFEQSFAAQLSIISLEIQNFSGEKS